MPAGDYFCFRLLSRNAIQIFTVFIALPVSLYGFETWFVVLRGETWIEGV
jgi:hypothetical protein